jgi:predicted nucleic acid-binding protein
LIVFDASTLVGAALKSDSVPERALLRAEEIDLLALSAGVAAEIAAVLGRPKFARALSAERRRRFLDALRSTAIWFEPSVRIAECRDPRTTCIWNWPSLPVQASSSAATVISRS